MRGSRLARACVPSGARTRADHRGNAVVCAGGRKLLASEIGMPYNCRTEEVGLMSKSARIELRAEPEQEERIRTAARLMNQSITTFVVTAAVERADEVIATWSTTTVSVEFFDQLLAALDHPAEANEAMVRAVRGRRQGAG